MSTRHPGKHEAGKPSTQRVFSLLGLTLHGILHISMHSILDSSLHGILHGSLDDSAYDIVNGDADFRTA